MVFIKNLVIKSKTKFIKKTFNCNKNLKFSFKFLLQYGLQLGGHIKLLSLETSSIIYGIRTLNIIMNVNITSIELLKILKIIEGLGYNRSIVYFINSLLNVRLAFKSSFLRYNRHLFFPVYSLIQNIFRKFKLLLLTKSQNKKVKKLLKRRRAFLLKSGKNLLRKIFVSTKWAFGFVSNSRTFFNFADNVLHERVKFGKIINKYKDKIDTFVDYYPFLPNYGLIGDHRLNYWIVHEFYKINIPTASVIDTFSRQALLSMYGIPGNACSIDSTLFFLIVLISNYLLGFNLHIIKFSFYKLNEFQKKKFFVKKNFFFKPFNLYSKLSLN